MRLLLDTHVLLWWWGDDPALTPFLREVIGDRANTVHVSAASAWEIATKVRRGRLPGAESAVGRFAELVALDSFVALPISIEHGARAGANKQPHRDPFDRILAAQSEIETVAILTRDAELRSFPCNAVWTEDELRALT